MQLSESEQLLLSQVFHQFIPNIPVYLFGSRATDAAKPMSDLDICLKADQSIPFELLAALENALMESPIPFKVDVVDWHRLTPTFQQHIKGHWIAF